MDGVNAFYDVERFHFSPYRSPVVAEKRSLLALVRQRGSDVARPSSSPAMWT